MRELLQRLPADEEGIGAAGDWAVMGNQQPVHTAIQAVVRRREQMAPDAGTGSGAFGYAATSRFEVGLNLYVNKDGPGSRGLRAARVRGPGLPPAGVVLTPMAGDLLGVQDWMPILRKDGLTAPEHAAPSRGGSPFFMLQRTAGLEGDEARTRRPNPFEGGTQNTVYPEWAHPLDYAQPPGSAAYVDFGSLGAMARYTFELFYEGEATPRHTLDKRLIAPVGPATDAVARRWARPDAQTLRYLDPADELAATVAG